MRTCAKTNGCAYELMIAERIDAACPVRAVLLMKTSSGSAGRASDLLLQRLLHLFICVLSIFILHLLPELL